MQVDSTFGSDSSTLLNWTFCSAGECVCKRFNIWFCHFQIPELDILFCRRLHLQVVQHLVMTVLHSPNWTFGSVLARGSTFASFSFTFPTFDILALHVFTKASDSAFGSFSFTFKIGHFVHQMITFTSVSTFVSVSIVLIPSMVETNLFDL